MISITRGIIRFGLIGVLGLGIATAVLGSHRMKSGFHQLQTKARSAVDAQLGVDLNNPQALRRHLRKLADEYPDRIAEVRGEIAEVDHQIGEFRRDIDVSDRVVNMTSADIEELRELVAAAEAERRTGIRKVALRFEGRTFDLDTAYDEAARINKVHNAYSDRLAHGQFQLAFLDEQKSRLSEILDKLEGEYDTYRTQLWQIEQQIAAMERNERLIELTKDQQATLDQLESMGEVQNLGQIESKLAEMRVKQEAMLEQLQRGNDHESYEERARMELNGSTKYDGSVETTTRWQRIFGENLDVDIEDDCGGCDGDFDEDDTIAMGSRTIIE